MALPLAFVDTTVMTDALLKPSMPQGLAAKNALKTYQTQLPGYAIKEFRAGPFGAVLWLYNRIAVERDLAKVWTAISALFRQRYKQLTAIQSMVSIYDSLQGQTIGDLNRKYGQNVTVQEAQAEEFRIALKSLMYKAWHKRRKITTSVVVELSCFSEEELTEKRGTVVCGTRKCPKNTDCSMRPLFVADIDDIKALRDVAKQGQRQEDQQRYKALRQLARKPKQVLDEQACRWLGDAVFAFFAPTNSVILTTNIRDHEPLAAAIGKTAKAP
jgi:hypothetical protein